MHLHRLDMSDMMKFKHSRSA